MCVVGSINVDLVVRTPRLPGRGETVLGGPFDRYPGGKGANQAVAAARAGASVAMVGALGGDDHGRAMRAMLEGEGIGHGGVRTIEGAATGVALITVEEGGENTIVVAGGANTQVDDATIEAGAPAIRDADVLLMQLEVPIGAAARAAAIGRDGGTRVVLNAAPGAVLDRELLALVDVLIVNRGEAALVAGREATEAPEALAQALTRLGVGTVVVTLGSEGVVALEEETLHVAPTFRVNAVDTVGAGDAFAGALCARLAEGADLETAIRFGAAAGALATVTEGAIPSLPSRKDIEWLVEEGGG